MSGKLQNFNSDGIIFQIMDHARVAVFEDDTVIRHLVSAMLEGSNHTVVAEASTVDDALAVIDLARSGELEIDAVLLDGNLNADTVTCEDARRIAQTIKDFGLATKIIGLSAYELSRFGIPVDCDLTKGRINSLNQTLDSL